METEAEIRLEAARWVHLLATMLTEGRSLRYPVNRNFEKEGPAHINSTLQKGLRGKLATFTVADILIANVS